MHENNYYFEHLMRKNPLSVAMNVRVAQQRILHVSLKGTER